MLQIGLRLARAWPLVAKRLLAHWRLLISVIIGVLLASTVMAGTVIYFDSLRGLALRNTLAKLDQAETNILVQAGRGPTSAAEYAKVAEAVEGEVNARVAWLLTDRIRGGKTATFFLTTPGDEDAAGEDNSRAYFAFLPGLAEQVTVAPGGSLPDNRPRDTAGRPVVIEALVPAGAALMFGVGVGDTLSAVPFWDDVSPYAQVTISGVFDRKDALHAAWDLSDRVFMASTSESFRTMPFYVTETDFMEVLGGGFRDLDSTYGWLLEVEPRRLSAGNAASAHVAIDRMEQRLSADLFNYRQFSALDEALAEYERRLFFSKLPMLIVLVLIAVVILYYVVILSTLVVERQRGEIALLRNRGASSANLLAVFALEGATISILAIAVAPLLAGLLISFLGYTPALSGLSGGGRLAISISTGAYGMSALGGLLSFGALMVPAVQASRTGVVKHRAAAARPASQPFFQRYYLDLMLLLVAVLLFRQLAERGSVVATNLFGRVAVDQLLLVVPGVVLVAFAVALLRLFPLSVRFLSGDSPAIVHLLVAGAVVILGPSIGWTGITAGEGLAWLSQLALLVALGGVYWATHRSGAVFLKAAGLVIQAGLVAAIVVWGPSLPLPGVSVPVLLAVVPAQVGFMLLEVLARRAPAGLTMALWQMARNPSHYARLSLLLILMAALGIFAASFGGTLERSFSERALYATGSDVRLEGVVLDGRGRTRPLIESYEAIPGVDGVSPAFRGYGTDLSRLTGEGYTMLAVDRSRFADVAWFRDDFAARPIPELLEELDHPTPPQGIELDPGARTLGLIAKADRSHRSIAVAARLRDSNSRYFTYLLGRLDSRDWVRMSASLAQPSAFGSFRLRPSPPLTLVSISIQEMDGRGKLRAGSVALDEIHVGMGSGEDRAIEAFESPNAWSVLRTVPEAVSDSLRPSGVEYPERSGVAIFAWSEGSPRTSRGIFHGPGVSPLPVLASRTFLDETNHDIGDEFDVSVGGRRAPVRLAASIDYFPTLDTVNDRFLIADLDSLAGYVNLEPVTTELNPNEVWLSTGADRAERQALMNALEMSEPFTSGVIHDRERITAESELDPLVIAGWRSLLFIAFAAVLVLAALGFLVHSYVSFRDREVQFGLMRTIGFSLRQLAMLVWLEQALVVAAGLALGIWVGGELGTTIMPFVAHDDGGAQVLPPFAVEISWGSLAIVYASMVAVFALITTSVVWFVSRISLQRVLRLGEA